jgi:hypothetical protein
MISFEERFLWPPESLKFSWKKKKKILQLLQLQSSSFSQSQL